MRRKKQNFVTNCYTFFKKNVDLYRVKPLYYSIN